jgi:hypothetical protein
MFISSYLVLIKLAHKFLAQFYGRSEKKTGLIVQVVLWKDCGGIEENIIYIDVLAHGESLI